VREADGARLGDLHRQGALVRRLGRRRAGADQGFYAKGGAAGVGQATTRAVVQSAVSILVLDYIVTSIITQGGL
jgi:hypothetical protein